MSALLPVSVVVITKNEATRIEDCLRSAAGRAAEIVVVDDASTDNTVEIARRFTSQVFQRTMDIEGKHRNWAYDKAAQPWVLSLDADERMTPELWEEIAALFAAGAPANGYTIPRRNFVGKFWARHGGMYPSAQLRLFRKGEFRYDEQAEVHPQAYMKDPRGALKNDILHYTYRDFSDAIAKMDRQTDLEARKWFRERRAISAWGTTRKMMDRFWRSYVSKKGFKDGRVGLFLAVQSGMYQFLSYAKTWEMYRAERAEKNRG